jgi:hypothetical protein
MPRFPIRFGHITLNGPKAAVFSASLKQFWIAADYTFKFITWIVMTSFLKYTFNQTENGWIGLLWLVTTILLFLIAVRICNVLVIFKSDKWYAVTATIVISSACGIALLLFFQSAITSVIASIIASQHPK